MAKKQTLDEWIHEALTDMDKGEGVTCSAMALMHVIGTASEKQIHAVQFTPGGKQWDATSLADLFEKKAQGYAQDLTGVQLFTLHAFYGHPIPNSPQASHPFRVNGDHTYDGTGQTEGPTGQGLVQQAMRHTEVMVQTAFRATAEANTLLSQIANQLGADNIALRKENSEAINIVKKLVLDDVKMKHELELERLKMQRNTDMLQKLVSFAPALLNNITGSEVFPLNTEDTALIESLFQNFDEKKMRQFASLLPPHIAGPFMARAEKFLAERAEKQKTDEEALAGADPIKELTE